MITQVRHHKPQGNCTRKYEKLFCIKKTMDNDCAVIERNCYINDENTNI